MRAFVVASLLASAIAFQTSRAHADEGDDVARAQFATTQSSETIETTVCGLIGAKQIKGRARAFDMRIGERRCTSTPMEEDAVAVRVRIEPREEGGREVVVEMDPSADSSPEETRATVADIGRELRNRLHMRPARVMALPTPPAETEARASSGLYGFGVASVIIGGIGVGGGMVVGAGSLLVGAFESAGCGVAHMFGGSGNCKSDVSGGLIAAGAMLGAGAAFLITGAISMSIGDRKVVTAYATPTGGGVRVVF